MAGQEAMSLTPLCRGDSLDYQAAENGVALLKIGSPDQLGLAYPVDPVKAVLWADLAFGIDACLRPVRGVKACLISAIGLLSYLKGAGSFARNGVCLAFTRFV